MKENQVMIKVQAGDVLIVVAGNVTGLEEFFVVQSVHQTFEQRHARGCGQQIITTAAGVRPISRLRILDNVNTVVREQRKQHLKTF